MGGLPIAIVQQCFTMDDGEAKEEEEETDAYLSIKERREAEDRKLQHRHAAALAVKSDDGHGHHKEKEHQSARVMLQELADPEKGHLKYIQNTELGLSEDAWRASAQSTFDRVNQALEYYTDALEYYPTWEMLYVKRAEAYRIRANLYRVPPVRASSTTEAGMVQNMCMVDLRRALSDVDHALRFYDPKFENGVVPEMQVTDTDKHQESPDFRVYVTNEHLQYSNFYAKAWLLRGHIRASLNERQGSTEFNKP